MVTATLFISFLLAYTSKGRRKVLPSYYIVLHSM